MIELNRKELYGGQSSKKQLNTNISFHAVGFNYPHKQFSNSITFKINRKGQGLLKALRLLAYIPRSMLKGKALQS